MKRYVFSFISFFDNDLQSKIIEAENRLAALEKGFTEEGFKIPEDLYDQATDDEDKEDLLKQEAFNCDSMIEVICID